MNQPSVSSNAELSKTRRVYPGDLVHSGMRSTWLTMAKDMTLSTAIWTPLFCNLFVFPRGKTNSKPINQIHKALLFFSKTKNNAVSLCLFLSEEFLKAKTLCPDMN